MRTAVPDGQAQSRLHSRLDGWETDPPRTGRRIVQALASTLVLIAASGLLSALSLGMPFLSGSLDLDGGLALWIVGLAYYSRLDWRLGPPFAVTLLGGYVLARQTQLAGYGWMLAVLLLVGVSARLIVSFSRDKRFVHDPPRWPIEPFWLFARCTGYRA